MSKKSRSRTLIIFYLLVIYVLIQFFWWGYLIMDLNMEMINLEKRLAPNEKITINYQQKLLMIFGEGSVFLIFLSLAVSMIHKAYRKEIDLANQQKNFLLSITHELKSPLASIRLYLQTIQKRKLSEEKQEEIIHRALIDTNRLQDLVEKILTATRIDSSNFSLHIEETDISKLTVDTLHVLEESVGINHQNKFNIQPNIRWKTDSFAFEAILTNLYENAVKYAPKHSEITINLRLKENKLKLTVQDEGIGIPDAFKVKIFEKFYRQGQEETRKTKGTGLGLYIVKALIKLLNGNIKVTDNTPRGSIFVVTFNSKKINE